MDQTLIELFPMMSLFRPAAKELVGDVARTWVLAGELSLSHARPLANG